MTPRLTNTIQNVLMHTVFVTALMPVLVCHAAWPPDDPWGTRIQQGATFLQTTTPNPVIYPRLAAPATVAATPNLAQPYRTHSWLGGALWGTGKAEPDLWTSTGPESAAGFWTNAACVNPIGGGWFPGNFVQHPVFLQTFSLSYSSPPHSAQNEAQAILDRGISLCGVYPYLANAAQWPTNVLDLMTPANATYWEQCSPMGFIANPLLPDLRLVPMTNAPPGGPLNALPAWSPEGTLVDRMGDFDADIIYQNPADPYGMTAFGQPGQGTYLKLSVCQGAPFTWIEARGIPYLTLRNAAADAVLHGTLAGTCTLGSTAPQAVPGVSEVMYFLIYVNQNCPFPDSSPSNLQANPNGYQDNWTTWAVYYRSNAAVTVTTDSANGFQNHYLTLAPASKTWLAIATVPTQRNYPANRTNAAAFIQAYNLANARQYAEGLGQYAFNFMTNSTISYVVSNMTRVTTTFAGAFANPYGAAGMTAGNGTIFTLPPHQYQPLALEGTPGAGATAPAVLDLAGTGAALFNPLGAGAAVANGGMYWSINGDVQTVRGTQYRTQYIFNNFLQAMPPPSFTNIIAAQYYPKYGPDYAYWTNLPLGQFLMLALCEQYVTACAQWPSPDSSNVFWGPLKLDTQTPSMYSAGFTMIGAAHDLALMQQFRQYFGNAPGNNGYPYNPAITPWIGMGRPTSPPWAGLGTNAPAYDMGDALRYNVQGVFTNLSWFFTQVPYHNQLTIQDANLCFFTQYNPTGHCVTIYPVATATSTARWPVPAPTVNPETTANTEIWEGFGSGAALNDHHYAYGYWISAAAQGALYDGAWDPANPAAYLGCASSNQFGPAIDALIMDIAYDPAIDHAFWRHPSMTFPKMQFFDQWAGHGWADGIQANIAGGTGHNENTIGEGNLAWSAIALWGIATGRKEIADLGIYLYATATYAGDQKFMDKNLNYRRNNPSGFWVPIVTHSFTNNSGQYAVYYPAGTGFGDYIPSTGAQASGCPKVTQAQIDNSTDFGGFPQAFKYIQGYPIEPWTLAFCRNVAYMNSWNQGMDNAHYRAWADYNILPEANADHTVASDTPYDPSKVPQMLMMQALGNYPQATVPYVGTSNLYVAGVSPLQFYLNMAIANCTTQTVGGNLSYQAPWVMLMSGDQSFSNPTLGSNPGNFALNPAELTISYVASFLDAIEQHGPPDWTIIGHAVTPSDANHDYVFNAAFVKGINATLVAWNPASKTNYVNFFALGNETAPLLPTALAVPPKQWALTTTVIPEPAALLACAALLLLWRRQTLP
ncbi:MAG: glycosyl hydrolase [bacterium]|nr:glycosyl hydrolase [bacterium]